MQLSMSSRRRGEGGGEGGILIDRFGPGVGHLNYLAVPGGRDINYFLGWGISVIFELTYLSRGREFYSNFLENVKIQPFALPPPPPPPLPAL